jgi:hypothetical protein
MTTTAPRKPKVQAAAIDLTKLAREDEAIHVRNTLSTITVLVVRISNNDEISEFGPSGDPEGNDVMELPSLYLKNAQFRKQLQRGIFEIIDADDPAVLEAMDAQKAAWEATQNAKHENDAIIDRQQVKAFSGIQCIAQEGRLQCAEFAISAKANNNEKPPLCTRHAHLASQYVSEETGKFIDNKPEVHWTRIQLQSR